MRRAAVLLPLLAALRLAAQAPPSAAPPAAAELPDEVELRESFGEAVRQFDSPDQPLAIAKFDELIRVLHRKQADGSWTRGEQELLLAALEYRGRALYNNGQLESAALDFRELLALSPDYQLREALVSSSTLKFFEQLRSREVASLSVSSEPAGATVVLGGRALGATELKELKVMAGDYQLRLELPGYTAVEERISLTAGRPTRLSYRLQRSGAAIVFLTDPEGVEIVVDGTSVGITSAAAVGAVAQRLPAGPPPPGAGALQLADLAPGAHQLLYRKDCYESVEETFEIDAPEDYVKQLVTLERSYARLSLRSTPAPAKIYLDGVYKGETPAILSELCAGTYRLEIKHPAGRYLGSLTLAKGERRDLEVELKPTLAYAGTVGANGVPAEDITRVDARLREALGALRRFNRIDLPADRARKRFSMLGGRGDTRERLRDILADLAGGLEAELLLLAYLEPEPLRRAAELYLYVPEQQALELVRLDLLDERAFSAGLARLDGERPLRQNSLSAGLVDAPFLGGLLVIDVDPGGPANRAGLRAGEVITTVNSDPVRGGAELKSYLRRLPLEEKLRLGVRGAAGERRFDLVLEALPDPLPLADPQLLYTAVLLQRIRQLELGPSGDEPLARLDLAIALMRFGRWAAAVEQLHRVRLEGIRGIRQGTVHYLLGRCLEVLGYAAEARVQYEAALSSPGATLEGPDGPLVAPLAYLRLAAMSQAG